MSATRRWLFFGTSALLVVALGLVVVRYLPDSLGLREPSVEADRSLLRATEDRLRVVKEQFDTIRLPAATTASTARLIGCSVDSGQVFQPTLTRSWQVQSGTAGLAKGLAETLLARGWTSVGEQGIFDTYSLRFDRPGWSIEGICAMTDAPSTGHSLFLTAVGQTAAFVRLFLAIAIFLCLPRPSPTAFHDLAALQHDPSNRMPVDERNPLGAR